MSLPTRRIGSFTVSAVGLGCMNLSHAYGLPPDEADGARLLNEALDLGVTLLDTAALYGGGDNERLIGRAVMHRRREFTLASKCVLDMIDGERALDGSPAAIARTLDGALDRLGTDHIDLYYLHRLDRRVPIQDSVGALARAVEAGKIGAIGLSEMSAATIRRAQAVHPVAAVQSEYSPMVRNPEIAVMNACRELGIALVAFSPVARGLLASAIRQDFFMPGDIRATMPRFIGENLARNLVEVARFEAVAAQARCTPAQLCLAWLLSRAPFVIPIPGTTKPSHLRENVAAATLDVDPVLLGDVDTLFDESHVFGGRYAPSMQCQIDTEMFDHEKAG